MNTNERISCWRLFKLFSQMALLGFGGVLPFAYSYLVERSGWLSDAEFAEQLGIAQLLPGPTICNLAVIVGQRFGGVGGAFAALGGLLAAPFFIVIGLGIAYRELAASALFGNALQGMAAAAAGLVLATAAKLAKGMWQGAAAPQAARRDVVARRIAQEVLLVLAFVGLGMLKLGLITVVCALAPLGFVLFAFVWRLP